MKKLLLVALALCLGGAVGLKLADYDVNQTLIEDAVFVKVAEDPSYSFSQVQFKVDGKKKVYNIHNTNIGRLREGYRYDLVIHRFQIVRPNNEIYMIDPGPKMLKQLKGE